MKELDISFKVKCSVNFRDQGATAMEEVMRRDIENRFEYHANKKLMELSREVVEHYKEPK